MKEKINELISDEANHFEIIQWYPVVTQDHGSEGTKVVEPEDCPTKSSCVSGSGGSLCVFFRGHASHNVVRCSHER
jgi:hypothetical protein